MKTVDFSIPGRSRPGPVLVPRRPLVLCAGVLVPSFASSWSEPKRRGDGDGDDGDANADDHAERSCLRNGQMVVIQYPFH